MLWEVEIHPLDRNAAQADREGDRVTSEATLRKLGTIGHVASARSYLIEGDVSRDEIERQAVPLLVDRVVESYEVQALPATTETSPLPGQLLNVLFKPGVTDNVGETARRALQDLDLHVDRVATCRKYWVSENASTTEIERFSSRVLANDAIEHVLAGPLSLKSLALGSEYEFELRHTAIRDLDDAGLMRLSKEGQLYLQLAEMQTIRDYFRELGREPTDIELETLAQTWSEHCSHKTLA
ncbi:MAG: phosphoribosylformylglycinamidine synthase, partial [Planctomycetaceae bacterium]|nr:phosphoribosylformylglycinamidine synthase [Planctomycetaceae bacterium]